MTESFVRSPQFYVRLAGVFYLAIIVLGLFGESYVRGTLVVGGDAVATAQKTPYPALGRTAFGSVGNAVDTSLIGRPV